MKFLRWLKFEFFRLMGYGNCWDCGAWGPLSWLKIKFADKVAQVQVEHSGHLCSPCWHKRMDPLKKMMDELLAKGLDESFKRV